jgi:hypothetical protein
MGRCTDNIKVYFNLGTDEPGDEDMQDYEMDLDEDNDKMKHDTRYGMKEEFFL